MRIFAKSCTLLRNAAALANIHNQNTPQIMLHARGICCIMEAKPFDIFERPVVSVKIDLSCPIEITHTEVLSDDRGRCRAYIDIINVSSRPIRRIEGHARWLSETGAELAQMDLVFEGMRLISHAHAQLTVAGEVPAAHDIALEPTEVAFSDFSQSWSTEDSELVEYEFTPEPPGPRLDRLRGIAGKDAVCYPEARGRYWLCVCGRLNPGGSHSCARCMRGRERVFAALREDGPRGDFSNRLARRERFEARREELRLQYERANRRKRERRIRILTITAISVLIVATLIMVGILLGYIVY